MEIKGLLLGPMLVMAFTESHSLLEFDAAKLSSIISFCRLRAARSGWLSSCSTVFSCNRSPFLKTALFLLIHSFTSFVILRLVVRVHNNVFFPLQHYLHKKDVTRYWLRGIIYVCTLEDAPVSAGKTSFKCFNSIFWPHRHCFSRGLFCLSTVLQVGIKCMVSWSELARGGLDLAM